MYLNYWKANKTKGSELRTSESAIEQKNGIIKPQGVWWGCADGHIEEICMISSSEVMPSISYELAPMTLPLMAEWSHQFREFFQNAMQLINHAMTINVGKRTPQSKRWANKVWKYPKYPKLPQHLEKKIEEGADYKCEEFILFISIVLCFESRELVGPIPGPRLTWRRIQERGRGSRRTPQSKRWANKVWKYPKYPKIHPNLKNGRKCS